jgi:hypothetical protein
MTRNGTFASLGTKGPKDFAIYIRRKTDLGSNKFTIDKIDVSPGKLTCRRELEAARNTIVKGSTAFLCTRSDVYKGFTVLPVVHGLEPALRMLYVPPLPRPVTSSELPIIGTWAGQSKNIQNGFVSKIVLFIDLRGQELVVQELDLTNPGPPEKDKYTKFENNVLYYKQSTGCGNWIELELKFGRLSGHANPAGGARPDCETKMEPKNYEMELTRIY